MAHSHWHFTTLAAAIVLTCSAALAQEPAADTPSVPVVGVKNPDFKPYGVMLEGVRAFDEHRALAPAASLRFMLIPSAADIDMKQVSLRLLGDAGSIAVPLAADWTFAMPAPAGVDPAAEFQVNKKKNTFRWRPDIRTPGLAEHQRRLGDLRLECEVRWAVEQGDMSFIQRNMFRALGGPCKASSVSVLYVSPRKIASATLVAGERRLPLLVKPDGHLYSAPLHSKEWGSDALVELTWK